MDKITYKQLNEAIDKVELRSTVDEHIRKNDNDWMKDFLLGIKAGIAAQRIVR